MSPSRGSRPLAVSIGLGLFSLSQQPLLNVIVPLWALYLGLGPVQIGLIAATGAALPAVFAIPAGALCDRIGARRVLLGLAATAFLTSLAYPALPLFAALLLLQAIGGLARCLTWVAAQSYMISDDGGRSGAARSLGLFGMAASTGTFASPIILGATKDLLGFPAAFGFAGLWGAGLVVTALLAPSGPRPKGGPVLARDLLPKAADYRAALGLLGVPLVALTVYATFLRVGAITMRESFYAVYLSGVGYPVAQIGLLVSTSQLTSVIANGHTGFWSRFVREERLLVGSLCVSVLAVSATPLFRDFVPLFGLAVLAGYPIGLSFPLLLSMLARSTTREQRGLSTGLRSAANYGASTVISLVMGGLVQSTGLEWGFYVMGLLLLLSAGAALGWLVRPREALEPAVERPG